MVAVVSPRSVPVPRSYPLPGNTTWTLAAATNGEYFYDYAGQDPVNNYDLDGTCLGIPYSGPCPWETGANAVEHAMVNAGRWLGRCGWHNILHGGIIGGCTKWGRRFERNHPPPSLRSLLLPAGVTGAAWSCQHWVKFGAERARVAPELAELYGFTALVTCALEGYHVLHH